MRASSSSILSSFMRAPPASTSSRPASLTASTAADVREPPRDPTTMRTRRLGCGTAEPAPDAAHDLRERERDAEDRQRRGEQHRGDGVDLRGNPELDLRVDVDRQRVVLADEEVRDDELVERQGEREERARDDRREQERHDDEAEAA